MSYEIKLGVLVDRKKIGLNWTYDHQVKGIYAPCLDDRKWVGVALCQ